MIVHHRRRPPWVVLLILCGLARLTIQSTTVDLAPLARAQSVFRGIYLPVLLRAHAGPFVAPPTAVPTAVPPTLAPTPADTLEPTAPPPPTDTPVPSHTPTATRPPTATPTPSPKLPAWHERVNYHRSLARLGPVTENTVWSRGCALHARYMIKENDPGHSERRSSRWWTQEGEDASPGNIYVNTAIDEVSENAVDFWMVGPFHQVAVIDPRLQVSGFGEYREAVGTWQYGATLDVHRGRTGVAPGTRFPVRYPEDGMVLPALEYPGYENPDPLTSCTGYTTPTGPPLVLMLGPGDVTPSVTRTSLTDAGGQALPHCTFNQTNYRNPAGGQQTIGRNVLAARSAIIVMPRSPLAPNTRYTVTIVANGATHTWSFRTAGRQGGLAHGRAFAGDR